jgi:hypothetical protein
MDSSPMPDRLEELFVAAARQGNGESLLTVAQVAATLRVEPGWVYEHAADLGALRLGTGSRAPIRFEARTLAARLRDLDAAVPTPTMSPTRGPRRQESTPTS